MKVTIIDAGLEDFSGLVDKFMDFKLASDGVLGSDFKILLKLRSETYKQIKDFFTRINSKTFTSSVKRKQNIISNNDSSAAKMSKNDFFQTIIFHGFLQISRVQKNK